MGFASILITLIALISSLISPEISGKYFVSLIVVLFLVLVLFMHIINYFKGGVESHEKEIRKINEKINVYKDISDLKVKVEFLLGNFKMNMKEQMIPINFVIRIIQIIAIIFAVYVILKVFGVRF